MKKISIKKLIFDNANESIKKNISTNPTSVTSRSPQYISRENSEHQI